jgi:hypothetical protein
MPTKNIVEGYFAQTAEGPRLLGSKCATCRTPYFPRTPVCRNPDCAASKIEDAALGPRGTLWSVAVQHYPPPAPVKYDEPFAPYAIGLVDMPEGLRILSRLSTTKLESLKIGSPVELVLEKICTDKEGNDVITWKFKPV